MCRRLWCYNQFSVLFFHPLTTSASVWLNFSQHYTLRKLNCQPNSYEPHSTQLFRQPQVVTIRASKTIHQISMCADRVNVFAMGILLNWTPKTEQKSLTKREHYYSFVASKGANKMHIIRSRALFLLFLEVSAKMAQ